MNIPSYQVSAGDVIGIANKASKQLRIQSALQMAAQRAPIDWVDTEVDVDAGKIEGTYRRPPDRSELPSEINENLIVELYSK